MARPQITIQQRLDMQRPMHNGLGYIALVARIKEKKSVLQICRDFNFTPPTFYGYLKKDKNLREIYNASRSKATS